MALAGQQINVHAGIYSSRAEQNSADSLGDLVDYSNKDSLKGNRIYGIVDCWRRTNVFVCLEELCRD